MKAVQRQRQRRRGNIPFMGREFAFIQKDFERHCQVKLGVDGFSTHESHLSPIQGESSINSSLSHSRFIEPSFLRFLEGVCAILCLLVQQIRARCALKG
jgi:hypothetical protein